MRILRRILTYTTYFKILVKHPEGFSHGVLFTEIPFGSLLGYNDLVWIQQYFFWIPLKKFNAEHAKKVGVSGKNKILLKLFQFFIRLFIAHHNIVDRPANFQNLCH